MRHLVSLGQVKGASGRRSEGGVEQRGGPGLSPAPPCLGWQCPCSYGLPFLPGPALTHHQPGTQESWVLVGP